MDNQRSEMADVQRRLNMETYRTDAGSGGARYAGAAGRSQRGLERLLEEQPLVVGAVAVLIGALLALILPKTRSEERLLGPRSASLIGRVREVASATFERAKETASQELSSLTQEVKEKGAEVVEHAKRAAHETVQTTVQTVQSTAEQEVKKQQGATPGIQGAQNKPNR